MLGHPKLATAKRTAETDRKKKRKILFLLIADEKRLKNLNSGDTEKKQAVLLIKLILVS